MSYTAAQAYQKRPPGTETPAQTEAWALATMARRLAEAQAKPDDREGMLTVIRLNWRLWTIFQSELADPKHPAPPELRSNLLNLTNFIDKHTVKLLVDPDPKGLDVLININRQLAGGLYDGLSQKPQDAGASQGQAVNVSG